MSSWLRDSKKSMRAVMRFIKLSIKLRPGYMSLLIVNSVLQALAPFVNIFLPAAIIDELTSNQNLLDLCMLILALVLGNAASTLLMNFFKMRIFIATEELHTSFNLHVAEHVCCMDYEKLEDADVLDLKEKALYNMRLQNVVQRIHEVIINLFRALLMIVTVVTLLAFLNPLAIVVVILINMLNAIVYRKVQKVKSTFYSDVAPYNRQYSYFKNLSTNFANAKDVRIYNMQGFLTEHISAYNNTINNLFFDMFKKQRKNDGYSAIILKLQEILAYSYVTYCVYIGELTIGGFTMYISAIRNFSNTISELVLATIEILHLGEILETYFEFENIPRSDGLISQYNQNQISEDKQFAIEFCDVSFSYPGTDNFALKDVNITINTAERLAIVGKNGAGKTTFIKLLCGLYRPQKGKILVNGINICDIDFKEYIKKISVCFQDYKILSFSVKDNLVLGSYSNDKRVTQCINDVGLDDAISKLLNGVDTVLFRSFDAAGMELSGGEMQKLAIARMLYKDSPVAILDEPTAALDAKSEYAIYKMLNEHMENKTVIYISHRLSSCVFCDNIAVFDNGELAEYGNHTSLVNDNGIYSELWTAQAGLYM